MGLVSGYHWAEEPTRVRQSLLSRNPGRPQGVLNSGLALDILVWRGGLTRGYMEDIKVTVGPGTLADYRRRLGAANRLQGEARKQERRALSRLRKGITRAYTDTSLRRSLLAVPDDREALTWFWFNHFNVFWRKGLVSAALPSYVDDAIRPHVLGRFRDLILATMLHPAMLVYLDNERNAANKINENYARELLELHTLGVDGGYSQADVQEAARLLTGFGLRPLKPVRWPPKQAALVKERGEFLFNPKRHDFGTKRVLGQTIEGTGYAEAEALADLLAAHPATARHIAGKLCLFLVGDDPPRDVVDAASKAFTSTQGDIASTVAVIRDGTKEAAGRTRSFKDPYRWVMSSVRLLAAGREIDEVRPVVRWLRALGEPLYGCTTPDGYSLYGKDWLSAGQLTQRFEIAREMVAVSPRMLSQPASPEEFLTSEAAKEQLARLGAKSSAAVSAATGPSERLALLIASPEFMYW